VMHSVQFSKYSLADNGRTLRATFTEACAMATRKANVGDDDEMDEKICPKGSTFIGTKIRVLYPRRESQRFRSLT
jgi:hypothetical protein